MHDLPDKAAKYLESLYEEATAAGRAFRRMGLPRWEARLRAWAEADLWAGSPPPTPGPPWPPTRAPILEQPS
ncbi:hypothetical protein CSW41_12525 [Thermus scotoductus]|uniref:Uncharacterized protein n=1 Tax=Thermus scotoductus TaxID=37636 RepID=A0A430RIR2_THESC|nr:hypothetical protein CSW41_12525 [Thermus scotoductus]